MRSTGTLAALLTMLWSGCGGSEDRIGPPPEVDDPAEPDDPVPEVCVDEDGDGFGPGCAAGTDCDDEDGAIHQGCITCGVAAQQGCACDEGTAPVECHSPAPEMDQHGRLRCFAGLRSCVEGTWSECQYDEVWNVSSEARSVGGVPGLCGNCDPQCYQVGGDVEASDVGPDNAVNTLYDCIPDGLGGEDCGIVIDGRPTEGGAFSYIAMPDDGTGTVAKIRNDDGHEVGRYYVGMTKLANSPSRTTIDANGNAYVANRAFGVQGTVTKIAGGNAYCIDRNGNGQIDTSTDSTPMALGADECVLWTTPLGAATDSIPRGLAVDRGDPEDAPEGYIWVGTWNDKTNLANKNGGRAYQVHPRTGAILQSIQLTQHVYGAVADNQNPQRVWFTNKNNGLLEAVNVQTGELLGPFWPNEPGSCSTRRGVTTCTLGRYGGYGVAFDGRHIWEAAKGSSYAHGYDIIDNTWCRVLTSGACDKGVAVRLEDDGSRTVYCGGDSGGQSAVDYWDSDFANCASADVRSLWCTTWTGDTCTATVDAIRPVTTYTPAIGTKLLGAAHTGGLGVGVDFQNRVWVVNRSSDNVAVYDPDDDSVITYPTTGPGLASPYTYSDFTGYQRAVFTNMSGTFSQDYGSSAPVCPAGQIVRWGDLRWTAVLPPNTLIRFTARTAGAADDLSTATPVVLGEAPASAAPLYVDDALLGAGVFNAHRYLRITATLVSTDGVATPILQNMILDWVCLDAE